jgi:hypothetical protein
MKEQLESIRRWGAEVAWGGGTWFVAHASSNELWLCPFRYCIVSQHMHLRVPTSWFVWERPGIRLRPIGRWFQRE